MSIFSSRLKDLRNKAKLSQQEFSRIIGISKSSINMYERGEREPGLGTVKKIADFFDVRTDYLLGKTDDVRSQKEGKKYNVQILQTLEGFRVMRGYDRDKIEDLFDWEGMYDDLENNRILGDAGMLKSIQGLLSAIISQEKNSPEEQTLTEGEKMLLELFRQIPADQQKVFLEMGRVYANSLRKE